MYNNGIVLLLSSAVFVRFLLQPTLGPRKSLVKCLL
jgi:hypothetical protein